MLIKPHKLKHLYTWEFWDWKSIIIASVIIGIFTVGFLFLDNIEVWHNNRALKLDRLTVAKITSIHRNMELYEGLEGNRISLGSVTVCYQYSIRKNEYRDTTYSGKDIIVNSIYVNRHFIAWLFQQLDNDSIIYIRYSSKEPSKSLIPIKED